MIQSLWGTFDAGIMIPHEPHLWLAPRFSQELRHGWTGGRIQNSITTNIFTLKLTLMLILCIMFVQVFVIIEELEGGLFFHLIPCVRNYPISPSGGIS